MKPTSYKIVSETDLDGQTTVVYTDQDNATYSIIVPTGSNLDQIILGD